MRHFLAESLVALYLTLTSLAFLYTMSHAAVLLRVPGLVFSYGMMAPYQGVERKATDIRAEGMDDHGAWRTIDLTPYYPVGSGETIARRYLFPFRAEGDEEMKDAYARMAAQLLRHEAERGTRWKKIRVSWQEWPLSTEGYEALRHAPFVTSTVLAEIP